MRSAVVTGVGAVCGWGLGVEALWTALLRGDRAFRTIRRFDPRQHRTGRAAEVPEDPSGPPGERRLTLADRFALAAAREALTRAGLPLRALGARAGVFFGSSTGGMWESECFYADRIEGRPSHLGDLVSQQYNGPGDAVARFFGVRGPVESVSSACTSGALAIGAALDALRAGEIDIALAGGSDSFCELTHAGFNSLRSIDPDVCRPFAENRAGLTLGEGSGVIVLETLAHAQGRGAHQLALLRGVGSTCDAHHMTAPEPSGRGASAAIHAALADAGLTPDQVDWINAHATATPLNDAAEWAAFAATFGARASHLPVICPKGSIGHLLGAAGGIEAVISVTCLERGLLPPSADELPDPALAARVVRGSPIALPGPIGISTNLAFGGSNTALVFEQAPAPQTEEQSR